VSLCLVEQAGLTATQHVEGVKNSLTKVHL